MPSTGVNGASAWSLAGKRAVLATMHGKERVVRPLLEGCLGLDVVVPHGFDTDRFGTFSREIERRGSQLDAARSKIEAAFAHDPHARVAIASEGAFGPHPLLPIVPMGREIVVLRDRDTGLELIGHHADLSTNFAHETVETAAAARAFAARIGFPRHGLIVTGVADGAPTPDRYLDKGIYTVSALTQSVENVLALCGAAHVETDMRANRNPTRMRAIRRATIDLVRTFRSLCPNCSRPGFAVTQRLTGLPCTWCGEPTTALRAEVAVCAGCGHSLERPVAAETEDPGLCPVCNP
ncbi:hypothetical protein EDC22_104358 [Tepidamorphus gemmatus]|uniref:DUF6671 domain-containing protein n=1 Tax=Tepidamorphus gemmatus TaxID=747076 RepID=A0A4R3MIP9_9HYPH|nr:DUF6671 family protein [Tepidamorphus gemmatus]TCT11595.1 hypothetical protein EDC22_104358 [Tepidamorphus gemmatus]